MKKLNKYSTQILKDNEFNLNFYKMDAYMQLVHYNGIEIQT
jgi:hypothetical protein